jgi:hypothetical protein
VLLKKVERELKGEISVTTKISIEEAVTKWLKHREQEGIANERAKNMSDSDRFLQSSSDCFPGRHRQDSSHRIQTLAEFEIWQQQFAAHLPVCRRSTVSLGDGRGRNTSTRTRFRDSNSASHQRKFIHRPMRKLFEF